MYCLVLVVSMRFNTDSEARILPDIVSTQSPALKARVFPSWLSRQCGSTGQPPITRPMLGTGWLPDGYLDWLSKGRAEKGVTVDQYSFNLHLQAVTQIRPHGHLVVSLAALASVFPNCFSTIWVQGDQALSTKSLRPDCIVDQIYVRLVPS